MPPIRDWKSSLGLPFASKDDFALNRQAGDPAGVVHVVVIRQDLVHKEAELRAQGLPCRNHGGGRRGCRGRREPRPRSRGAELERGVLFWPGGEAVDGAAPAAAFGTWAPPRSCSDPWFSFSPA